MIVLPSGLDPIVQFLLLACLFLIMIELFSSYVFWAICAVIAYLHGNLEGALVLAIIALVVKKK